MQRVISISERGQLRKPRENQLWILSKALQNQFSEAGSLNAFSTHYNNCRCIRIVMRTDYNVVHIASLVFVPVLNSACHDLPVCTLHTAQLQETYSLRIKNGPRKPQILCVSCYCYDLSRPKREHCLWPRALALSRCGPLWCVFIVL